MKKMLITASLVALLVAVFAAAAFAVTEGTCKNYPCNGNHRSNVLTERRGDGTPDKIYGKGRGDTLTAFKYKNDKDVLIGGQGRDHVEVNDGDTLDKASGGPGLHDLCMVDSRREVGVGCNEVWVFN